jgi:hypothetical protein
MTRASKGSQCVLDRVAVTKPARCMGIPETQYVINQLTVERSCTLWISGANERITGPGAASENGEVG